MWSPPTELGTCMYLFCVCVTPRSFAGILSSVERLNEQHIPQLRLNSRAVTTAVRVPPGHHTAITSDGSEGSTRGLNLLSKNYLVTSEN